MTERTRRMLGAAVSAWLAALVGPLCSGQEAPPAVIVAYVFPRDKIIDPSGIAAAKLTHINYAFANVVGGKVVSGSKNDAKNLAALASLRKEHPRLKILASVGGWLWSGGFSDAASTPQSRARFAESAWTFVRRHDLDGIDIDWEYPGLPGAGNKHGPEDREGFTLMIAEIRRVLDREGSRSGRHYLVTFAAGANTDYLEHVEMEKLQALADLVNLMTYDFREGEDRLAGHHANLRRQPADDKGLSVEGAVASFLAAGVPAGKLVVGVPFYGHGWTDVEEKDHGLYQPGKPLQGMDLHYGDIAGMLGRGDWARYWDQTAEAPFLFSASKRIFVTYDDPESLGLKCRFIRSQGLAGAMFWEYYADRTGALLSTLATELGVKN